MENPNDWHVIGMCPRCKKQKVKVSNNGATECCGFRVKTFGLSMQDYHKYINGDADTQIHYLKRMKDEHGRPMKGVEHL